MRKNAFLLAIPLCLSAVSCAPAERKLAFDFTEKEISSGDYVTVSKGKAESYRFIGGVPEGVSLEESTGLITYGPEVLNGTQLLYKALSKTQESDAVVLTLTQKEEEGEVAFSNLTDRLTDGDRVYASSSNGQSVSYSLSSPVPGVSVDSSSGIVRFAKGVGDGTSFVVTASSGSLRASQEFVAAVSDLAFAKGDLAYFEAGSSNPVAYFIDFPASLAEEEKAFLGVLLDGKALAPSSYEYDAALGKVLLFPSALSSLSHGKHRVSLVSQRNSVNVTLSVATKFIASAEDLASINDSQDALKGYYVQISDIDLTSYLGVDGAGNDSGKGWKPIGAYRDVADGTAFLNSFQGTYDGGGHVISGLWMNRNDETAYNAGLFGYVYSTALIENLGVKGTDTSFRSFCGGFVGSNDGTIRNCYYQGSKLSSYSGENVFRYLGGFVGQNQGTISCCYASVDQIQGDRAYGSFAGNNTGEISNCVGFSSTEDILFQGEGVPATDSHSYPQTEDVPEEAFASFSRDVWDFSSSLPSLKQNLYFAGVFSIELLGAKNEATIGESFELSVRINPSSSQEEYEGKVVYSASGCNVRVEGNKVITEGAEPGEFTLTASLEEGGKVYSSSVSVHLYAIGEALDFASSEPLYPGRTYTLKAKVTPETAKQEIAYSLSERVKGVHLDGDQLRIGYSANPGKIALGASSLGLSSSAEFEILPYETVLDDPRDNLRYAGETQDLFFHLPEGEDASSYSYYLEGEEVSPKAVEGNAICFSGELLRSKPGQEVNFRFEKLSEKKVYVGAACYLDEDRPALPSGENVTVISSLEQFASLFNVFDYEQSRYENYGKDKIYILDCDLNFAGRKVYSIGYDAHPFLATIYGNNHVISNFGQGNSDKVENEYGLTLDQSTYDGVWNYRPSLYGVGFFGTFGGSCYDLVFENTRINASNWVGNFSGSILADGKVRNVHLLNCKALNVNGVDFQSTASDSVSYFAPGNEGEMTFCSYDHAYENLTKGKD